MNNVILSTFAEECRVPPGAVLVRRLLLHRMHHYFRSAVDNVGKSDVRIFRASPTWIFCQSFLHGEITGSVFVSTFYDDVS